MATRNLREVEIGMLKRFFSIQLVILLEQNSLLEGVDLPGKS